MAVRVLHNRQHQGRGGDDAAAQRFQTLGGSDLAHQRSVVRGPEDQAGQSLRRKVGIQRVAYKPGAGLDWARPNRWQEMLQIQADIIGTNTKERK